MANHMRSGHKTAIAPLNYNEFEEYEVQPGETLTSIAYKKKISQKLLRKINKSLMDTLLPGEILIIPIIPEEESGTIERRFSQFTIKMKTTDSPRRPSEKDEKSPIPDQ